MRNDFNQSKYYNKAANILKLVRLFAVLLFVMFLLSCILVFRDSITLDNVQYLMKYADFYDASVAPDNAEISISADSESQMLTIRDNLAVVSRSGIGLYEFSEHKLFNYNFSYSCPAVIHDDRNVLVYDIKGTGLSVFNSFSRVYSQEYPYGVKSACMSDSGIAIVTGDSSYRSVAIAYNSKFEEIFRWESAERYVISIDLSQDGTKLVCGAIKSVDGIYDSKIIVYDTRSGEIISECSISDELILKVSFSEDDKNVVVMTDSMIRFYTHSIEEISKYKYNQSKCENFYIENDMIILTESNNLSGNSMKISGFDYKGNLIFSENADSKVTDVSVNKHYLFALSAQCVYIYSFNEDKSISLVDKIHTSTSFTHILSDSNNRYILSDTKKAVRFSIKTDS